MGKMKVYDLAKELDLTSKEILEKAKKLGINAKSHLSSLEDDDVEKLKKSFLDKKDNKKDNRQNKKQDKDVNKNVKL